MTSHSNFPLSHSLAAPLKRFVSQLQKVDESGPLVHCRRSRLECAKWPSRLVVTGGTSKDLFGCCYNLQTTQHTAGKDTHWLNVFLQGLTQQVVFRFFFHKIIIASMAPACSNCYF